VRSSILEEEEGGSWFRLSFGPTYFETS